MATHYKRIVRMEMVAHLEAKGIYTDNEIAAHMGMTAQGLIHIKADPDYALVRQRYLSSLITRLDEEMGSDIKALRYKMQTTVPAALRVLQDNLNNPDARVRNTAAIQILNRDGRLAEVSKIGITVTEADGSTISSLDDEIANALTSAKKSASSGNVQDSTTIQ